MYRKRRRRKKGKCKVDDKVEKTEYRETDINAAAVLIYMGRSRTGKRGVKEEEEEGKQEE